MREEKVFFLNEYINNRKYIYIDSIESIQKTIYGTLIETIFLSILNLEIENNDFHVEISILRYTINCRFIRLGFLCDEDIVSFVKILVADDFVSAIDNRFNLSCNNLKEQFVVNEFGFQLINNMSNACLYDEPILLYDKLLSELKYSDINKVREDVIFYGKYLADKLLALRRDFLYNEK